MGISDKIGDKWPAHLDQLANLRQFADDPRFQREFMEAKSQNKRKLAAYLSEKTGVDINPASIFDIQVKRIHEYKRQLLTFSTSSPCTIVSRPIPTKKLTTLCPAPL